MVRRTLMVTLCSVLMAGCEPQNQTAGSTFAYPETQQRPVTDVYFGTEVVDPYRWLEDDMSEETAAWVDAQNSVTFEYLGKLPHLRNGVHHVLGEKVRACGAYIQHMFGLCYDILPLLGLIQCKLNQATVWRCAIGLGKNLTVFTEDHIYVGIFIRRHLHQFGICRIEVLYKQAISRRGVTGVDHQELLILGYVTRHVAKFLPWRITKNHWVCGLVASYRMKVQPMMVGLGG